MSKKRTGRLAGPLLFDGEPSYRFFAAFFAGRFLAADFFAGAFFFVVFFAAFFGAALLAVLFVAMCPPCRRTNSCRYVHLVCTHYSSMCSLYSLYVINAMKQYPQAAAA